MKPTADDLLQEREELREQGIAITAEDLCREATDDVRREVASRLSRIELAERAVEMSLTEADIGETGPFVPLGYAGRYVDPRVKAEGGMGVLCIADDIELGRVVAYKVMKPGLSGNSSAREQFFHEAEITSWLNHPGVVPVYGRVTDDSGMPAYASAFVTGRPLSLRIEQYHAIDLAEGATRADARASLLGAFIATCEVVAYAHTMNIVHGDVKPSNILTDDFDATRLVDWGLARFLNGVDPNEDRRLPMGRLGTLPFISAIDKPATFASDIYALGLTLAFILADSRPEQNSRFRPALDSPLALWAISQKAMKADRAARYGSASELASDIRDVLADRAILPYSDPPSTRIRRWANSHRPVVATTLALLIVAATAGPLVGARERTLRNRSEIERVRAVGLTREMLNQADHVGRLQATLPGSKALLTRAVQLIEQLASDSEAEGSDLGPVAESYYRAGRIYQNLSQLNESAACFQKSADRAKRRFKADPNDAENLNLWACALRDWGVAKVKQGGDREAVDAWKQAIQRLTPVASRSPEYRWTLSRLHSAVGIQEMLRGEQPKAMASYEQAQKLAARLVDDAPSDPRFIKALGDVISNKGLSFYYQSIAKDGAVVDPGRLASSNQAFTEALRLRRSLKALEPGNPEHLADLASSLKLLGNVQQTQGPSGFADAIESYRESRSILETLVVAFPSVVSHRQDLAQVFSNLNVLLANQNRIVEAKAVAEAAVDLFSRVLVDRPDSPETLAELGVALVQRAETLRRGGETSAASESSYKAAVALARAASLTQEPNRREALAGKSIGLLIALDREEFFKTERRAADLAAEAAFDAFRSRPDFPRP